MDEETKRIAEDYGLDEDTALEAQDLMDEGFDEEDAVEIAEEF